MGLDQLRKKIDFVGAIHLLAAIVTIVGGALVLFANTSTIKETVFLIAFTVYFLIILLFLIYFAITHSRKARYSEASNSLHNAVHAAREAFKYLDSCINASRTEQYDESRFRSLLERFLTSVSTAFSIISGTKCRSALKVLGQSDTDELFVISFARDAESSEQQRTHDAREGRRHLVANNTDFDLIAHHEYRCFFHNNLPKYENYMNTSLGDSRYQLGVGDAWRLPYKSTIVWPIRFKMERSTLEGVDQIEEEFYGFLTVDSGVRGAFRSDHDVPFGAALADALFPVFSLFNKVRPVARS
jgi:hypothetical protein